MAESTLSLKFLDFKKEVGGFLGFQRTEADWSTVDAALVDDFVHAGVRQVYAARDWSFLRPTTTLSTVAGDKDYDLADDFAHLCGDITFDPGEGIYPALTIRSESFIRRAWQNNSSTARPVYAATRPKTHDGTDGQRQELILYPIPDAVYVLNIPTRILPAKLTTAAPYPYGGSVHSELFTESCLSIAEARANDASQIHREAYSRCLDRSWEIDKQVGTPDYIRGAGSMSDLSFLHDRNVVQHEGTTYLVS